MLNHPLNLGFKTVPIDLSEDEKDLLLAGIIMMVLLERDRG